jgi:hypothetical protein
MGDDGGADDDEVERPALSRHFYHVGVALALTHLAAGIPRWRLNAVSRGELHQFRVILNTLSWLATSIWSGAEGTGAPAGLPPRRMGEIVIPSKLLSPISAYHRPRRRR